MSIRSLRIPVKRSFSSLSFQVNGAPAIVLKLQNAAPVGTPGKGEIKVAMKNFPVLVEDILALRGFSFQRTRPGLAGSTGIGIVSSVGGSVSHVAVSDPVFVVTDGCWSQDVIVPASSALKIPKLSSTEATLIPAVVSALGILSKFKTIKTGDTIAQINGDTDIGQAISQVGKEKGYKVINVTTESLNDNSKLGEIKFAVSGSTGSALKTLLKALATGGTLVNYNSATFINEDFGTIDIPTRAFIFNDTVLSGFSLGTFASSETESYNKAVAEGVSLISSKKITIPAKTFPIADYAKAFTSLDKAFGLPVGLDV